MIMPNNNDDIKSIRTRLQERIGVIKMERATFIPHYEEIGRFFAPRRGRYQIFDRDKGGDRYQAIINSKGTQAWRTARSGLLAGSMSPVRPWFTLETPDPGMMSYKPVQIWLAQVQQLILAILAESNFYNMSATMLGELLLFATGAMLHVDDYDDVARFYTLTVGSYMLGQDDRQCINTLAREFMMMVGPMVKKFGLKNVSEGVKTRYDKGDYDAWYPVSQVIQPNEWFFDGNKSPLSHHKRFASVYFEPGAEDNPNKVLDFKGFDDFPAYVPRWETTAEDIYGTDCPGMTCLGDTKGLQIQERRKGQAVDKMVNPPLRGPAAVRQTAVDSLPGGLTIYDTSADGKGGGLVPLYQVDPKLQEMRLDMTAVEGRIDNAFYMQLWKAITNMAGIQPRNELELRARDQERLLELGPVLERLHGEFLANVVNRTFNQCLRAVPTLLPPAPLVLKGKPLKVKFISALATAQNAMEAGTIERNTTFIAGLVTGGFPDAGKKLDVFATIDEYAKITGLPPKLLLGTPMVKQMLQQQAAQQQAATNGARSGEMADIAAKGAGAAKNMATAAQTAANTPMPTASDPLKGDNVLKAIQRAVQYRGNPNIFVQGQPPGPQIK